ncbi:MAG: type VI secretion system tube protein Hcp [Vicinamibacterales bacterium]
MASDIFLKLGDIKGESADAKHKDEVEVTNLSWAITNHGSMHTGQGGGTGKATFGDIQVTKMVDKASPVLQQACATGEHYKEATITARKQGKVQIEFLTYKLTDVIVTGVSTQAGGDGQNSYYTENVSLQFAKVVVEYKAQKADGTPDASVFFKYNIKGNVKL